MTRNGVAVWLGIDWADEKHRWAMRIDGESRIYHGELELVIRREAACRDHAMDMRMDPSSSTIP
jgi:hypothetical protein